MTARQSSLDILRGLAIILMFVFHLSYYIAKFGFFSFDFSDSLWKTLRFCILLLFLGLVGVGLALQVQRGINWRRYAVRLSKLAAVALCISIGSYLAMPKHWIYFGIIQFIFVANIICLPLAFFPKVSVILAAFIAVDHHFIHFLHTKFLFNYLQPILHLPNSTADITYFFPWIGLVLLGIFIGYQKLPNWPFKINRFWQILHWMGQHALMLYLLHIPIVAGIAAGLAWLLI